MRYADILNEMPIKSLDVQGGDDPDLFSFGAADRALLNNPKARAKIIRGFQKTPFDFEIIFLFNDAVDGDHAGDNEDVDDRAKSLRAGVHGQYRLSGFDTPIIKGKPGVIRVLMLGNLSPVKDKMPMTAWTLAHKIGHAIQDSFSMNIGRKPSKLEWAQWTYLINQLLNDISASDENYSPYGSTSYEYPAWLDEYLTMKSARTGKVRNGFEIYAELIAQYLITGKITMKLKNPEGQAIVGHINDAMAELFSSLVGKVLVEV